MPNHITNILTIGGVSLKRIAEIRKAIRGKGNDSDGLPRLFDFNKIIPMPQELKTESAGSGYGETALYAIYGETGIYSFTTREKAKAEYNALPAKEKKEAEARAKFLHENIQKYGAKDWWDWAVKFWGTKWNAYEAYERSKSEIGFFTAWSTPEPIICKLSEMFPDAEFHMAFADEDMGSNCGYYTYKAGEGSFDIPKEGSDRAMQVAMEVQGSGNDYIKFNGEWRYADDLSEEEYAEAKKQAASKVKKARKKEKVSK